MSEEEIREVFEKMRLLTEEDRKKLSYGDLLHGLINGSEIRIREDTITTIKSNSK